MGDLKAVSSSQHFYINSNNNNRKNNTKHFLDLPASTQIKKRRNLSPGFPSLPPLQQSCGSIEEKKKKKNFLKSLIIYFLNTARTSVVSMEQNKRVLLALMFLSNVSIYTKTFCTDVETAMLAVKRRRRRHLGGKEEKNASPPSLLYPMGRKKEKGGKCGKKTMQHVRFWRI